MKNLRLIQAKYNGNSNTITLIELRYKGKDIKRISFNYGANNTIDNACIYLQSIGLNIIGYGSNPDNRTYTIISDSWADKNEFINIKGITEKI